MPVSNAVELIEWGDDPLHLNVCAGCLEASDHDGDWVRVRRAGSYVLFLPAFSRWMEGWQGEYDEQPPGFLLKGAMLLDRAQYQELRGLVPDLPKAGELKPLAGWEAVRLLRFEAPVKVLGDWSTPVRFQRGMLLSTDSWYDDDRTVQVLERLLETWAESWEPVALKTLRGPRAEVTLYLNQERGSVDWQPLAVGFRWARLLLAPGYFVDEVSQLAAEDQVNTLRLATRLHEGTRLWPEIFVDDELLLDFTGSWLGVGLLELAQSLGGDGEYFILTCSCGDLGCAGFNQGIEVLHDGEYVHWVMHLKTATDPLRFEAKAYRNAITSGLDEFQRLRSENPQMSAVPEMNLDFGKPGVYPGDLLSRV